MGKEYVHFIDAIPEIKQFLTELENKEALKSEEIEKKHGRKLGDLVDLKSLKSKTKSLH